jgi:hypothetical protein
LSALQALGNILLSALQALGNILLSALQALGNILLANHCGKHLVWTTVMQATAYHRLSLKGVQQSKERASCRTLAVPGFTWGSCYAAAAHLVCAHRLYCFVACTMAGVVCYLASSRS